MAHLPIRPIAPQPEGPKSICDLIDYWAERSPNHTALLSESRKVTYKELNSAATRIAWILVRRGVQPGQVVPVLATRTCEMVAAFLGVLKTGACYVPIDVDAWGEDRILSTLERVSARVVVNLGNSTSFADYNVVTRGEIEAAFNPISDEQEVKGELYQAKIKPTDLVYIVFTSGTTSQPKGVMIPHQALLNYVQQGDEEAPFNTCPGPEDKSLLTFSPGFDAGTGVVFAAICNGSQLIVVNVSDFEKWVTQATIIAITPSMLSAIHNVEACSRVRTLILGGEPPHARLIEKWTAPGRNIYNGYGPSETTVGSLIARVGPSKPITLGRPMSNSRVILLDGDEEADYGEICLTGPGLAIGYYQDEATTAQKFVYWRGERMYRTGDFARRTEHGLEYAGRVDSFVKNRGFLVNIDSQVIPMLLHTEEIHTATAFMHKERLVAFVTPAGIDTRALRQRLYKSNDAFIVPDQIRALAKLPLTANGKADNKSLRQLLESEMSVEELESNIPEENISQLSKIEILKLAVATATALPLSLVSETSSFSELGGNSLAALKVLSYLRSRHLELGIKTLFEVPDLKTASENIRDNTIVKQKGENHPASADANGLPVTQESTAGPMTALQTKMIQASLRIPGANTMLIRIRIPHAGEEFDRRGLKEAWQRVLDRHSIFRTTFTLKDESQHIKPDLDFDWSEEVTTAEQLDDVVRIRSSNIRRKIVDLKLQDDTFTPTIVFDLVTVPKVCSVLLFSAHHAQADGWSFSLILDEVQKVLRGSEMTGWREPTPFIDVAVAQNEQQRSPEGTRFWTSVLRNASDLPKITFPRPASSQVDEWTKTIKLDLGFKLTELERAGRDLHVTPSALIYTAWGLVLSMYTSSNNVAFGAVFSGRNLAGVSDVDHAVGPLLTTVPFPVKFESGQIVSHAVKNVHNRLLQMLEFQWSAVEAMAPMARETIDRLLQTLVVTEYDLPPPTKASWAVEREDLMEFALTLLLERSSRHGRLFGDSEDDQYLQARILYDGSKITESFIHHLLAYFKNAITGLAGMDYTSLRDVRAQIIDDKEKQILLHNPTTLKREVREPQLGRRTIKDAFEAAAQKYSHLLAIMNFTGEGLTYQELDESANKLAWQLRDRVKEKLGARAVVGVLSDGSPYWVISLLAVIKSGFICCPIDVNLPKQRIDTIIDQAGVLILLAATRECANKVNSERYTQVSSGRLIVAQEFIRNSEDACSQPLPTSTEPEDVFYLVFTSGSTGTPKGISLHNLSILNFLDVPELRLFTGPGRRTSQLNSLGFDMVLVELFATLCYGGCLILKNPKDPFEHLKLVNAIVATPSLLSALSPEDYPSLEVVLSAGEIVPQALADAWSNRVQTLLNTYGPSECGCISTATILHPGDPVTIGRALPGVEIYILDNEQCPVPQGVTGEIYISGVQVTRGYFGDIHEEKTKSLFITNPFSSNATNKTLYRTGDLAFWREDMDISYVGRADDMVKIRGFRVELGEVEFALHIGAGYQIQRAAAVVVGSGETGADNMHIVGFVSPANTDVSLIRENLATILPAYSRPSYIFAVPELPTTANSKVDCNKLADMAANAISHLKANEDINEGDELSSTEKAVAQTWKELFGLRSDVRLGRDDDFLDLGGNSVLAIKAARKIGSSLLRSVPVSLVARESNLGRLAGSIDKHIMLSSPSGSLDNQSFSGFLAHNPYSWTSSSDLSLSYLESDLFHSYACSKVQSVFSATAQFTIYGPVKGDLLAEAFTSLVREHPMLRARYMEKPEHPRRFITGYITPPEQYAGDEMSARKKVQRLVDKPFDLAKDQLFRVLIWKKPTPSPETEVTMATHHIITDKESLGLMLRWASAKYESLLIESSQPKQKGRQLASRVAPGSLQRSGTYIDWAEWLHKRVQYPSEEKNRRIQFWKQHLQGFQPISPQLHDFSLSGLMGRPGSTLSFYMPPVDDDNDSTAPKRHKYSQRLAVAATALALHALFGTRDVVLGLPYLNREEPETVDMLGFFIERLPIRIFLNDDNISSTTKLLNAVSGEIQSCIDHRLSYPDITQAIRGKSQLSLDRKDDIVDVMLVYDWESDSLAHSFSLGPDIKVLENLPKVRPTGALFPLEIAFHEDKEGGVFVNLTYSKDIVCDECAYAFKDVVVPAMKAMARGVETTPSFFTHGFA